MVTSSQQKEIDRKKLHKIKMSKGHPLEGVIPSLRYIDDPADNLRHKMEQRARKAKYELEKLLPEEIRRKHCADWQRQKMMRSEEYIIKYNKEKSDLLSKPDSVFDVLLHLKEKKLNELEKRIQEQIGLIDMRKKKINECLQ